MSNQLTMIGGGPYYFPGNTTGCLMIHGFTGTPKELRWMGEYLHKQGYTVAGIRLAGHATQIPDLVRAHWQDWLISVEDGINLLQSNCKKIFTIGLSLGGMLSLIAADRYKIHGAIAMSTPFSYLDDWRLNVAKPLSVVYPSIKKGPSDLLNKKAAAEHLDYPVYPTRATSELFKLKKVIANALPKIKIPVLIMHSKADSLKLENAEQIYSLLTTPDKELYLLEKSGHVITEDIERLKVFNKADEFIRKVQKNR
jgi:carboxylesterase